VEQHRCQAPPVSKLSTEGDATFKVLVDQLCEEYPGLSPDRAGAALRLTKQNNRFNVYAAARVLPGQEGVPIELRSPSTISGDPGKRVGFGGSSTSDSSATWIDANSQANSVSEGLDDSSSGDDDQQGARAVEEKLTFPPSKGEGAAMNQHLQGSMVGATAQTCDHHNNRCEPGVTCGEGVAFFPVKSSQKGLADQAIRFASHTISLAAKCSLEKARSTLGRHMVLCSDLIVAAQRACQEIMDGAPVDVDVDPENLPSGGGLRLVERHFGAEGRTPSVREIAKRSRENGDRESPLRRHLFDDVLAKQMSNAGEGLTAEQRLTTGIRRTEQHVFREAQVAERTTARRLQQQLDELADGGDGSTPASAAMLLGNAQTMRGSAHQGIAPETKTPRAVFHASPSVRVAQQMQLKRELASNSGSGAILVVNSAGTKLPTWRAGAESEGRGFNWKTKQKMVHAWEAYQMSEGLHAPKSFKSMIDADLIPLICAECNLDEGDWEVLDDVTLLIAIEDKLKPHDAMDFTVQLKLVPFEHNAHKGSLTQRYRLFAEAFLSKVSEAKAAGFTLPENVIKLAFTRALQGNALLQGWLEQEKWVSVAAAHRRITNSLKMVDAYHTLQTMSGQSAAQSQQPQPQQLAAQQPPAVQQPGAPLGPAQQRDDQQQQGFRPQIPPVVSPAGSQGQLRRNQRFDARLNQALHQALAGYQTSGIQQQNQAAAASASTGHQAPAASAAMGSINVGFHAGGERKPLQLSPFPGLDARGLHWHVHSSTLGCKTFPCNAPFCQACAVHHHSANECRKRFYNNPGANHSGYWCEQRPGGVPLRSPAPTTANAAIQFGAPPFPTPYVKNGNSNVATAAASSGATPSPQTTLQQQGPATNYAARQQRPLSSHGGSQDGRPL
jgi:hypothetical protein